MSSWKRGNFYSLRGYLNMFYSSVILDGVHTGECTDLDRTEPDCAELSWMENGKVFVLKMYQDRWEICQEMEDGDLIPYKMKGKFVIKDDSYITPYPRIIETEATEHNDYIAWVVWKENPNELLGLFVSNKEIEVYSKMI